MNPQLPSALPQREFAPRHRRGASPSQTHEGAANYRGLTRWGGGGGPYPVCPSSGQGRKAALLGLSSATEGQLKHWSHTDSKGSLPSSLKLFCSTSPRPWEGAEPLGGPDHAPRSLFSPGGTKVARSPGPPPARDLAVPPGTQSPPPRARPRADEGLDPRQNCAPRGWRSNSGKARGPSSA